MNRDEFRQYMNEYKQARESNPSLSYWQWKANKYEKGTDEITNTTLPEVVITPKRNYVNYPIDQDAYNSAMLDAWGKQTRIGPEDVIDYVPIIGDIKGVYDIAKDFTNKEYLAGATGLGLTLLPNFIEKPLRRFANKVAFKKANKVSHLDWSPQSWFGEAGNRKTWTKQDEDILQSHVPEYLEIEKTAKQNGTFLKNSDGSTWKGDPREWVMRKSKNAEKWSTEETWYTGVPNEINFNENYNGDVWLTNNKDVAKGYSKRLTKPLLPYKNFEYSIISKGKDIVNDMYQRLFGKGTVFSIGYPKNSKQLIIDAQHSDWNNIPANTINKLVPTDWKFPPIPDATEIDWEFYNWRTRKYHTSTDELVRNAKFLNKQITRINNVSDLPGNYKIKYNDDLIIHENTPRISWLGNNGDLSGKGMFYSDGTDGIVDEVKATSRTTLSPEEQQYLLNKSKQRQKMSGAITPVFDIQDAVDFTPIGDILTARDT